MQEERSQGREMPKAKKTFLDVPFHEAERQRNPHTPLAGCTCEHIPGRHTGGSTRGQEKSRQQTEEQGCGHPGPVSVLC